MLTAHTDVTADSKSFHQISLSTGIHQHTASPAAASDPDIITLTPLTPNRHIF